MLDHDITGHNCGFVKLFEESCDKVDENDFCKVCSNSGCRLNVDVSFVNFLLLVGYIIFFRQMKLLVDFWRV